MADRGFKGIQTLLLDKNCELIRPPSVSTNAKLSKEEALETKRIASLRIHIEKVIRRLRKFSMLQPCANLSSNYIKHLDSMVIIAAALSNLQSPIIKIILLLILLFILLLILSMNVNFYVYL